MLRYSYTVTLRVIVCLICCLSGKYAIGQSQKFPVYLGCESVASDELEACFNSSVKNDVLARFKTPEVMVSDNFKGTVNVLFFVDRNGNFTVAHVNSPYRELEETITAVFNDLPSLVPAHYNGHAVEMSFSLPLHFPNPHSYAASKEGVAEDIAVYSKDSLEMKPLTRAFTKKFVEHQSNLNIPFHHARYAGIEKEFIKGENVHTAVKPYTFAKVEPYIDLDAQKSQFLKKKKTWLGRKFWNEHLALVQGKNYWFSTNLLLDVEMGMDNSDVDYTFNNSRILQIQGELGSKFSFSATIFETQGRFAEYVNREIDLSQWETFSSAGLVFGRGKAKQFKEDSYDYPVSEGYIAYKPNEFFDLQMGQGKNFVGDGYRSMLLSDVTAPYPYVKIVTNFWKIQYTNLWMWMTDIRKEARMGNVHPRKYVASHHLSINITKKFNLGLFEAVMTDNSRTGVMEMDFFNPIIFYKSLEFARGEDAGSAVLGTNASYKFTDSFSMYGQFVLDEFTLEEVKASDGYWGNKFGAQIGLKYFDAFKVENLYLQLEYNQLRPYTFSHGDPIFNYGHYGEAIAHAWGANFREMIVIARYTKDRWAANFKTVFGVKGFDADGLNYGGDIFKSYDTRVQDYGNEIAQGTKATIFNSDLQVSYLINPTTNLKVFSGLVFRQFTPEESLVNFQENTTTWFTFGLKVDLFNWYLDF